MILRPDTDHLQASSLSLAAQLPETTGPKRMGRRPVHTALSLWAQGPEPGRGPVTSSSLREFTMEENALRFPIYTLKEICSAWGFTCDHPTPGQRLGNCFCSENLVTKLTFFYLGCHPSQQWSLTPLPSQKVQRTHRPLPVKALRSPSRAC